MKQKLDQRGYNLTSSIKRRGCHLLRASSPHQICLGRGGVILIGEAAGWISPSSAEGLSYAFRSALALAQAMTVAKPNPLPQYRRLCRGLYVNILGKIGKSPGMYWPILRRLAMTSGLFSLEVMSNAENFRDVHGGIKR